MKVCFIICDTLRADRVTKLVMPELYKLSQAGADYPLFFGDGGTTELSLPFFLSGKRKFDQILNFPAILDGCGYDTRIIHSNAVIPYRKFDKGFGQVYDMGLENNRGVESARRFLRKGGLWQKSRPLRVALRGERPLNLAYRRAQHLTEVGCKWLGEMDSGLLWIQFMDSHIPYDPPGLGPVERAEAKKLYEKIIKWVSDPTVGFTELERARLKYFYDLECTYLDTELALLVYSNPDTWFIITSDHGDMFGRNYTYSHAPGYMGLTPQLSHLPLIFFNNDEPNTKTINSYAASVDIGATILDMFEVTPRLGYGRSLWPEVKP